MTETRTEWEIQHFREGKCVHTSPAPDLETGKAFLAEDREDMPGADLRLMTRTVTTTPWEEVQ